MKRMLTAVILILFCFSLSSCGAINQLGEAIDALKYTISGDIIDPVDGFSRGAEKDTLIYKDNNYIIVQGIDGDCDIDITEEDILLGLSSNYPFFPCSCYYVGTDENPNYIIHTDSGNLGISVYLREDIYSNDIVYVLNDSSFEFEYASAFIKIDQADYNFYDSRDKSTSVAVVSFYMKEFPTITVRKQIYLIDNTWYSLGSDAAYILSDELVCKLIEKGILKSRTMT